METVKAENLFAKLSVMRVELQEAGIEKTGENKYSNFKYFELDDFLPKCNEIAKKHKAVFLYELHKEEATLTLINCENTEERIAFSLPLAELTIKGANGIQNIGGLATYTRRYLYMIAFEISEKDSFDPNENNVPKETHSRQDTPEQQAEIEEIKKQKIPQVKVHTIQKELIRTGVPETAICERYNVASLSDITEGIFPKVLEALKKTK